LLHSFDEKPRLSDLYAGLEISSVWIIPYVRRFAIHHIGVISRQSYIHPAIMISLARRHGVPEWIRPAVQQLRNIPLSSLAAHHDPYVKSLMTLDTYEIIARLRERLLLKSVSLAIRPPDVSHVVHCINNDSCYNAWHVAWVINIGTKLIHPEDYFRPGIDEIKASLETLTVPTMTQGCLLDTLSDLRASNAWDFEARAIDKAVELLMVPAVSLDLDCDD
jgi:hypothetical protein